MLSYYIFFIISFSCTFFDFLNIDAKQKKSVYILFLCFCILFFGGRYECDGDYFIYVEMYERLPCLGESYFFDKVVSCEVELGFSFLCSLFKTMTLPPQSIFLLSAFLTFLFVGKSFWLVTKYPFTCMFLYLTHFYNMPFIQIRYGVAMALVLYGCILLQEGKMRKFFFCFLGALSFHVTALAALVPLFLSKINLSKKNVVLLLAVSFVLLVVPIKSMVARVVGSVGIYRYVAYLSEESNKYGMYLAMLLAIWPFLNYRNIFSVKLHYCKTILTMALGSILLLPLGQVALTFSRFSSLLFISFLVIFSSYFILLKKTMLNWCLFYFLILLYGYVRFKANIMYVESYNSIFFSLF